jgi:hypothetical protein
MTMNQNMGQEIGWDDTISQESEFITLPEGEYNFVVESMERGRFAGSEKMGPCPSATLSLGITDPASGRQVTIKDTLYLNTKAEWKLSQFFICIGQKKHGEDLRPDWNKVPGSTGRCKITQRNYTSRDGEQRTANNVSSYLEHEDKPTFTKGTF